MCVQDFESTDEELLKTSNLSENSNNTQMDYSTTPNSNSSPLESINEERSVVLDEIQTLSVDFVPTLRSGEWSDIGGRDYMEDTHVCIPDLAKNLGSETVDEEAVSFYGVFDGHGGKAAAQYVRDHLPRVIVEDADFPVELEKVVTRSFIKTDTAFARSCPVGSSLSSGTTAITAMIFGRSLLVANAGDSRAVLCRRGMALEMSKDHRPCCRNELARVESLGGYVEYGYLNGQLGVTRALGDWHLEGMKHIDKKGGPLSAEPELKLVTLTKEDEFLIIGCDGIWDVFSNQNVVDFVRKRLQTHNDVKLCCKEVVEEAIKRDAMDNLTVVIVSFHLDPPPAIVPQRMRFRRSISADGLQNIRNNLEG
ncbi:probable protein phosphatase 2C 27 isoform X1 [Spinacia oleracea]|uniref:protein-serine/threonine phosphatase n=2 Tax=Spinacia oleracea TaxID=3562 RepID=A0A9R0J2S5_SPIOL|nr:probable protein phosphatase 2C 27 isoform X1 [Spinacia oleracea]